MFEAIRGVDHATLRTLARTFIGTGNIPAALLCLDHVFSSPLKLQNLTLVEARASLSLYLDYIRLLNKLLRDTSLAEGSNRQRLFGFQVLGEGRYLAPKRTLLREKLANRAGSTGNSMDGYRCGSDELCRGIVQLIKSRISDRTKIQDGISRDVHGFSPCLQFLVEKKCDSPSGEGPCALQHIQPEQLTVDWYHARLRLILLQFQILNLARYDNLDVKKCVLAHSMINPCGCSSNVKDTGLGYCIQYSTHLFRGSDRLRILAFSAYPRRPVVSGLCENGFDPSAMTTTITPDR